MNTLRKFSIFRKCSDILGFLLVQCHPQFNDVLYHDSWVTMALIRDINGTPATLLFPGVCVHDGLDLSQLVTVRPDNDLPECAQTLWGCSAQLGS